MLKIDTSGKVTVSLGGRCTLGCKHCYTNTKSFVSQPTKSPSETLVELQAFSNEISDKISVICVSGDTDCFLDPDNGVSLLELIVENFSEQTIMFTTRLVLSNSNIDRLAKIWDTCRLRNQLFIPCISLVSFAYPNGIENPSRVPTSIKRLDFLRTLASLGMVCFLTLRPTFPFTIVSFDEIRKILKYIGNCPVAVLGEVLLLDNNDEITSRLSIQKSAEDSVESSAMTFIEQPEIWHKLYRRKEHTAIKGLCNEHGLPFFLRSMSAINYLTRINTFQDTWIHDKNLFDAEIEYIYP